MQDSQEWGVWELLHVEEYKTWDVIFDYWIKLWLSMSMRKRMCYDCYSFALEVVKMRWVSGGRSDSTVLEIWEHNRVVIEGWCL